MTIETVIYYFYNGIIDDLVWGGGMQRWVVLGILVLLVFSSFGFVFAEQF